MLESIDNTILLRLLADLSAKVADAAALSTDGFNGYKDALPSKTIQYGLELEAPSKFAILHELMDAGAPISFAQELATIHCDRANDLISEYTSLYAQTCNDIPFAGSCSALSNIERLAGQLQLKYYETVRDWKEEMFTLVKFNVKTQSNVLKSQSGTGKRSFNHSFVPVLEVIYAKSPLPSRADKVLLAKKSGMSYKQVHVWFQNRRNREKRANETQQENKAPAMYPQTPCVSLDGDETEVDVDEEDAEKISQNAWSRCSSFTLMGDEPNFAIESPPYAFPTPYPPPSELYPFPCQKGDFSMPKAKWPREKRGVSMVISPVDGEADVDTLVVMFRRMSIADEETVQASCAAVAPFATYLPPAPLPSLICTPFLCSNPELSTRADRFIDKNSRNCPRKLSPMLKNVATRTRGSFVSSAQPIGVHDPSARKRSGFPKRMPKGHLRPGVLAKVSTSVSVTRPIPQHTNLRCLTQLTPSDAGSSSSSQSSSPVNSPSDLSDIDGSLFVVPNSNSLALDYHIPNGGITENSHLVYKLSVMREVMPGCHSGSLANILPRSSPVSEFL